MNDLYRPNGALQGDTRAIPSRGTGTGMPGNAQTAGMSTDMGATNRIKGIGGATKSDPVMDNSPGDESSSSDRD